jgi:UDP:flavonoid glycosyltransferase YjiC (YdhE family)
MAGRRVLVFSLPFWGHVSFCLGVANSLTRLGDEVSFTFVYPPPAWVLREIAAHGYAFDWTLKYVRSGLGQPDRDEQFRAVVAAETEMIHKARPDLILSDVRVTTPAAGRACGVPVVSVLRVAFRARIWRERWGDAQLTPYPEDWLAMRAPFVGYCRPAWVERRTIAAAPVESRPIVASLSTAEDQPRHLRVLMRALDGIGEEWVLCYPHPDEVASSSAQVVAWAEMDGLLAGARVLVCHGGLGILSRGVMQGVPVVILQTSAEQSVLFGEALEAWRAGILVRRRDLTAAGIREAVLRAQHDEALRAGAAALRRSFESLPEAPEVMDAALASAGVRVGGRWTPVSP